MCQSINSTYVRGKTLEGKTLDNLCSSFDPNSYPPSPTELLSSHILLSFIDQSISTVCVDVPLIKFKLSVVVYFRLVACGKFPR